MQPLTESSVQVAGFYAKMLDHEYTQKDAFNKNYMHDWRKVREESVAMAIANKMNTIDIQCMTAKERELITDLKKCDFTVMADYFKVP